MISKAKRTAQMTKNQISPPSQRDEKNVGAWLDRNPPNALKSKFAGLSLSLSFLTAG